LDEDLKDALGIVKYEPPEPTQKGLNNEREHPLFHRYTDIQNFRNFPEVFTDGEEVIAVEKAHGTNSRIGLVAESEGGRPSILCVGSHHCRKRLSGRDLYEWPLTKWYPEIMLMLRAALEEVPGASVILHGEIYGKVQDLRYDSPDGYRYAAFDLSVDSTYLPFDLFAGLASKVSLPTCPVAYRGAFSVEAIDAAASGATLVGGDHMREGIVIRPAVERMDPTLGRVILKRINDDYLTRKGGTENH